MASNENYAQVRRNEKTGFRRALSVLCIAGLSGLPQVSMPLATMDGMPLGLSLIGPRPDIYDLGMQLAEEIPYYTIRSIIKPGLSGWAQIKQELPPQSSPENRPR